jgi:hypothetical protein
MDILSGTQIIAHVEKLRSRLSNGLEHFTTSSVCHRTPGSIPSSSSDHRTHQSHSSNPVAPAPTHRPHCRTYTPARHRRTPTRRRARCPSTVRGLTHIRNSTPILLRNHMNLARRIATHEETTLGVPSETHRAETRVRAGGEIGVKDDIDGGGDAIR